MRELAALHGQKDPGARGAHQGVKRASVTDFREQPPEQEGRKEKRGDRGRRLRYIGSRYITPTRIRYIRTYIHQT